jgi:hypothetical protein
MARTERRVSQQNGHRQQCLHESDNLLRAEKIEVAMRHPLEYSFPVLSVTVGQEQSPGFSTNRPPFEKEMTSDH